MKHAVYAGTFDPVTAGHLSVVERAAPLFDRMTVLVAVNPAKASLFSVPERVEILREALAPWPQATADATEELVINWARANGARWLVRGLRGASDSEMETSLAHVNHELASEITTILVPARPDLAIVSSSMLKQLARGGADLTRFCPPAVARRMVERLGRKP